MVELNNKLLCELIEKLYNLYDSEKSKLPYGANVIDELHAGENAHSRILRLLLQYTNGYNYPVYTSFIKLLSQFCKNIRTDIANPEFSNEENRIDVLIKERKANPPYSIIIENKVCEAEDQDCQIERYIESIKDCGIESKNIYVVYLTSDGNKIISDSSLTENAKKWLDVTNDNKGRFIELNYKYDILPWLEQEVLPNTAIREDLLISSVRLYIDYLKGMFEMRVNDKPIINIIQSTMKKELGVNSLEDCINLYKKANWFSENCSALLMTEINNCLEKNLYEPLKAAFPDAEIKEKEVSINSLRFIVELPNWNKCYFKLERDHDYGITLKDINNPISEDVRVRLKEIFPHSKKYKENNGWPVYKALKKNIPTDGSIEFWKDVESGEVKRFFIEWIKYAIAKTNGWDM